MALRTIRNLAFGMLIGVPAVLPMTAAAADDSRPREAVVMVSGEGQSAVAPDMAVLSLAVVKQAKTAREALDENNKAMAAVLAALKKEGIADRDLQTSGFSVQPQYNYPQSNDGQPKPPELIGYQVSNGLTVRVRDLGELGGLIDQAVTLGVNQGGDIQFTNDKPEAAMEAARKDAVAAAMKKAKTLTEAAGVKLGRVIEISESGVRPMPQPAYRATMAKEAADASVPIQGGENTYHVTVNLTFALEQ
ncbi:SIMPL domain-containing protein [Rhizobium sp. P32RR-XVIII]|uniref:SIMPL domain-containing protein n=1 Tax=Rhizobium sp. P32RR-XVIII TaxID=2726738 RepID=UPI0014563E46|nr:SIMPL domain-containing protein [Rhizobium sp. P32RR-XVIII]